MLFAVSPKRSAKNRGHNFPAHTHRSLNEALNIFWSRFVSESIRSAQYIVRYLANYFGQTLHTPGPGAGQQLSPDIPQCKNRSRR